ncbi:rhomboid family intramembrane serine protease [Corynebacterium tuscaniense]|uniref:rhomboid family intramembrane serine protease n=1 Tax=Corynebacterium tuscaniense TaxID=302449 RepID=UPI00050F9652|nr:rhomboid family intramembrane serine protease [Corynebacterium tuscaniense]KAA8741168.1 rhomboid family intramembrane serine protease [Corynebacterium tuscaniense]KGF23413.1 membrane protein [Corynebacterium tuscaniense DNF00037]
MKKLLYGAPATTVIAVLCAGVFLLTAVQSRSVSDVIWGSGIGSTFVLWGPAVSATDMGILRALTAGFLHVDISHLTINLITLVVIGAVVERAVGTGPYVVAYLAGVLGGSAAVLTFAWDQPTAGASGALYMLMAILVGIAARSHADLRAPLVLVLGNVAYTLLSPEVSLWGHLGGLAIGALMAGPLTSPDERVRWAGAGVGFALASAAAGIYAAGV